MTPKKIATAKDMAITTTVRRIVSGGAGQLMRRNSCRDSCKKAFNLSIIPLDMITVLLDIFKQLP